MDQHNPPPHWRLGGGTWRHGIPGVFEVLAGRRLVWRTFDPDDRTSKTIAVKRWALLPSGCLLLWEPGKRRYVVEALYTPRRSEAKPR